MGWLKRYLATSSKWKSFPLAFEFSDIFKFGVDYIERIMETSFNPFWVNILTSLKSLWKDNNIIIWDNILLTPLWYNDTFRLQIYKKWIEKGIHTMCDLIETNGQPMSLESFESKCSLKSNFLEYGIVCKKN